MKRPDVMEKERAVCGIPKFLRDEAKVCEEINPCNETSLRHFFYLEYRKVPLG